MKLTTHDMPETKYKIRGHTGAYWISYQKDRYSPQVRVSIQGVSEWSDKESVEKAMEEAYWRAFRAGAV